MEKIFPALWLWAWCVGAWAQTPPGVPMQETISVNGASTVTLAPDRVVFTVGVESTGATLEEATRLNSEKTTQVVAALKKAGVTDREMQTSNFSITPRQDFREGRTPRITGYQVNNSITVTRDNVANAGALLQAAIDAGGNQASSLNFTVADQSRGRTEGLQRAFEDARAKAQVLAQAAGRSLGRALIISEGGGQPPFPPQPLSMKAETAPQVPVEPGARETHFNVSVVFELR
ncbi:MAG: SIMPL domain-containing protein [Pseudomonadota bacterium]